MLKALEQNERREEPMKPELREWIEKRATKLIGIGIVLTGLAILWGCGRLRDWLLLPYALSELGEKLGDATIIAGVLALALDSHLKKVVAARGFTRVIRTYDWI